MRKGTISFWICDDFFFMKAIKKYTRTCEIMNIFLHLADANSYGAVVVEIVW